MVDPAGRASDSLECVLPERRIVEVRWQIFQHKAEGRSWVLQVMDPERRHGLECFHLFLFHEPPPHWLANTLKQVYLFRRIAEAPNAVCKDDHPEPVLSPNQRNTNRT